MTHECQICGDRPARMMPDGVIRCRRCLQKAVLYGGLRPKRRKIGRNERCWCGSGKKFKRCCVDKQVT